MCNSAQLAAGVTADSWQGGAQSSLGWGLPPNPYVPPPQSPVRLWLPASLRTPPGGLALSWGFGIGPGPPLQPQALSVSISLTPSLRWLSRQLGGEEGRMGLFRALS